jgi:nucleotide-binding universal stress UspA family protein
LRAVQEVLRVSATDVTVYLVHVISTLSPTASEATKNSVDDRRLALRRLEESLRERGIQVRSTLLFGVPAVELLRFADGVHADLVACGAEPATSRPAGSPQCSGRVTMHLITHAPCPVLVIPDLATSSLRERSWTFGHQQIS